MTRRITENDIKYSVALNKIQTKAQPLENTDSRFINTIRKQHALHFTVKKTLSFDISVIDIAMLIAIIVLFALHLTRSQRETNKQKRLLKIQRAQRESITQETAKRNSDCPHKFGFLQTQKNKGIPEECAGCAKIIKCLLPDE